MQSRILNAGQYQDNCSIAGELHIKKVREIGNNSKMNRTISSWKNGGQSPLSPTTLTDDKYKQTFGRTLGNYKDFDDVYNAMLSPSIKYQVSHLQKP